MGRSKQIIISLFLVHHQFSLVKSEDEQYNQTCIGVVRREFDASLEAALEVSAGHKQLVSGRLEWSEQLSRYTARTIWRRNGNLVEKRMPSVEKMEQEQHNHEKHDHEQHNHEKHDHEKHNHEKHQHDHQQHKLAEEAEKRYSPLEVRDDGLLIEVVDGVLYVHLSNSTVNCSYTVDLQNEIFTEILLDDLFFTFALDKQKTRLLFVGEGVEQSPAPWTKYRGVVAGARNPTLFILDLYEQQLRSVDLPPEWIPGRSTWDPAQNGLITIARKRMNNPCPHCPDSETYLVYVDLNSRVVVPNLLTQQGLHISSPVFCPHGDRLLILRNNITDTQGVPVSGHVSRELVSYAWPPLNLNPEVLIPAHQEFSNFQGIKRTSMDQAIFFAKEGDEPVFLVNSDDDIIGAQGGSVLVYYPRSSSIRIMERPMKILDVAGEMILAASVNITDTQIFLGSLVPEVITTTTLDTTRQTTTTTEKATTAAHTTDPTTTAAATTTPLPLTCQEILESYRNSDSEDSTASIPIEATGAHTTTEDTSAVITSEAAERTTADMLTTELQTTEAPEVTTVEQLALTPSLSMVSSAGFERIFHEQWSNIHFDSTQLSFRAINRKPSNSLMVYLPTEANQQIKMEFMKFWLTLGWDVLHLGYELGSSGSLAELVTCTQLAISQISSQYERIVLVGEGLGGTLALLVAANSNKNQQVVTLDAVMDLHSLILYDRKLLARLVRKQLPFIPTTEDIHNLWANSPLSKLARNSSQSDDSSTAMMKTSGLDNTDFLLFSSGVWPKQSETFYDLARKGTDASILLVGQGSPDWFGSAGVWLYSSSGEEQRRCRIVVSPVTPRPTTEGASTTTAKSSTSRITPALSLFLYLALFIR